MSIGQAVGPTAVVSRYEGVGKAAPACEEEMGGVHTLPAVLRKVSSQTMGRERGTNSLTVVSALKPCGFNSSAWVLGEARGTAHP